MREDYQSLIDEVSALLGTPATLEGRDFGLIAFAAHEGEDERVLDPVRARSILRRGSTPAVREWFEGFGIARARGPVRIPPDPAAGVLHGRICLPARHGGVVHGYIWLLDDDALPLDDPRLLQAAGTAARIGGLLAADARAGERLGDLLAALLTAGPGAVPAAAEALAAGATPAPAGPLALVAVTPWQAEAAPPVAVPGLVTATVPGGGSGGGVAGRALAALVRLRAGDRPGPARTVAERLLASAGGTGAVRPVAGIGAPVGAPDGLAGLPGAWRQALAAARAARAEPRLGPVAHWAGLGPYRLLTALPPDLPPDASVRTLLRPAHAELARTAEVYLDHAGQVARAAAELGVHRQTLYYRLSRIEALTGLSMDSGEDRLLLHMALKSARLSPGR
ncbi:PucR family transcriptional regulator [Streptomyces aidingensis]|uniref:DNA-binding transcriptional regulator, PucR family n=1 Tax=Streptomyces aidingensis TaxID=910347 RepID=A0A1I1NNZ6_9ACTN|nr:helix-turn-helix domain-containing protein [Streptomyces aidingensis]SFC99012.1 DNA-binding transcriptional regulator, PucR family [Streptomyces aidingensis]